MNLKFWLWQIWKPSKDEPKKWKCCDKLVKPSELEQHYKENHWGAA